MKGLHTVTPRLRYDQYPYITEETLETMGGQAIGYMVDRWAEGQYPLALWRHGRVGGTYYIIKNHDDRYWMNPKNGGSRERYQGIMEDTRRDTLNGTTAGQWYIGFGYIPDMKERGGELQALPEFSDEELATLPITRECEHNWDAEGYCLRCETYNDNFAELLAENCTNGNHQWYDGVCDHCGTVDE